MCVYVCVMRDISSGAVMVVDPRPVSVCVYVCMCHEGHFFGCGDGG